MATDATAPPATCGAGPAEVLDFWFPEGSAPALREHERWWHWRHGGGAQAAVVARFPALVEHAAAGGLDAWAQSPLGRLALIVVLDGFSRALWAGTPRVHVLEPRACTLSLQGLANAHYDALTSVWHKAAYRMPLEHCECAEAATHLAHLDIAVTLAERLAAESPPALRPTYTRGAEQARRRRAVIARFGRYPQRNALLGRASTPQELAFVAHGDLADGTPENSAALPCHLKPS